MATPFSDVFDLFLSKITDQELLSMPEPDLESTMTNYLISSIPRFRQCKNNLYNYDKTNMTFAEDLTIDEEEILAQWMLYEYLNQNTYKIELLKQSLSQKDFARFSQAKHLQELSSLKQQVREDTYQMIVDYSYYFGEMDDLK